MASDIPRVSVFQLSNLPSSKMRVPKMRHARWWAAFLPFILLSGILINWSFLAGQVYAAPLAGSSQPGHNTFQQFVNEGQKSKAPHSAFAFPAPKKALKPGGMTPPKPGVEPPTMKPLSITLSANDLSPQATSLGVKPLDLRSSDGRLEIQIPAGAFDLTHATTVKGAAFVLNSSTTVTLHINETQGYTPGNCQRSEAISSRCLTRKATPSRMSRYGRRSHISTTTSQLAWQT